MAEQQAQQYSAPLDVGHGGIGPGGSLLATGKSLPAKMTDSVRKRPGAALAAIVVLVILVLFLYAQQKGWFGLGGSQSSMRAVRAPPRSGSKKARAPAAADNDDPETEDLIDSINGSGR